jgi:hypothetical protein
LYKEFEEYLEKGDIKHFGITREIQKEKDRLKELREV